MTTQHVLNASLNKPHNQTNPLMYRTVSFLLCVLKDACVCLMSRL